MPRHVATQVTVNLPTDYSNQTQTILHVYAQEVDVDGRYAQCAGTKQRAAGLRVLSTRHSTTHGHGPKHKSKLWHIKHWPLSTTVCTYVRWVGERAAAGRAGGGGAGTPAPTRLAGGTRPAGTCDGGRRCAVARTNSYETSRTSLQRSLDATNASSPSSLAGGAGRLAAAALVAAARAAGMAPALGRGAAFACAGMRWCDTMLRRAVVKDVGIRVDECKQVCQPLANVKPV